MKCLTPLLLAPLLSAGLAAQPPGVCTEFVFEKAPFAQCHASTIVETKAGLVAAWFGGTREKNPDVGIWVSRHTDGKWSAPVEVANGIDGEKRYPCWNPVLFQPAKGPLLLFYKVGPSPSAWWGMAVTSDDDGKTWSKPRRLPKDVIGPVKNKPVELADRTLLCPTSDEHTGWQVRMERLLPEDEWRTTKPLNDGRKLAAIQPSILVHKGRLQILCRSKHGVIVESWSEDGGKTWSEMTKTELPNPNSGIDAVTLKDGRHLLISNPSRFARSPLSIAVSKDGKKWKEAVKLETEPGEYSYPAIIQTNDGLVHAVYTWKRQRIKHAILDPAKLEAANPKPRNIVVAVGDDLSPDLGCYGNKVIKTPNLDKLAADATRFRHAFCTTASCSPSRSVLLSGLHNHANRMYGLEHGHHHFRADERLKSLPAMLKEAGYRTARVGKFHVGPEEAFKFDEVFKANARSPAEMADACKELIAARDEKPFFLYYCTADPHRSGTVDETQSAKPDRFGNRPQGYPGIKEVTYDPKEVLVPPFLPDTPACRQELAQYCQSVSRVDQGIARLIQHLQDAGKWDDTLFVFLSDHGIPFPGSKTTVYEPGLRIPLIVRHPGLQKRGIVSEAMISMADLTPSLLDFAGAPAKKGALHGRSFLPILEQEKPEGWDEVYASHTFHESTMYYPMRAVRGRQFKLIWNIAHPLPFPFAADLYQSATWQDTLKKGPDAQYGQRTVKVYVKRPAFELYDLAGDPHEVNNLASDAKHADLLKTMQGKLKDFQKRTNDPWIHKWDYE